MSEETVVIVTVCSILLLMLLLLGFIAGIMVFYQKKRKAFLRELHNVTTKYEQEILRVQLEVQEQTLSHVSREIHDNIGQSISLAKLYLLSESSSNTVEKIDHTVEILTKAMDDLRTLSKNLTIEEIKSEGLGKVLENQVNQLKKTGRYAVRFEVRGRDVCLDDQREIVLFRIFQETINNIIRHAQATMIHIDLNYQADFVSLFIFDNGIGFPFPVGADQATIKSKGRGLNNMTDRAQLIGATLAINSRPGLGTSIEIKVPVTS